MVESLQVSYSTGIQQLRWRWLTTSYFDLKVYREHT